MTVKCNQPPKAKDKAKLQRFMHTNQLDTLVVQIKGTGEEFTLHAERHDADGRTLVED